VITNKGKEIIAKYLLGTTPAYASYMAFGCGAKPLSSVNGYGTYDDYTELQFEMFRVPISSRGYVKEDIGNNEFISKIVFTSELPTQERYEITEIGIFPAGGNPSASGFDSRTLIAFAEEEQWQYLDTTVKPILTVNQPLDTPADDNIINTSTADFTINNVASLLPNVFQVSADNNIFFKTNRNTKNERCRYLNNMLLVKGNYSAIKDVVSADLSTSNVLENKNYIIKTGLNINLVQNSLSDKIKIAFSLINKNATSYTNPGSLKIILEFIDSNGKYARSLITVTNTAGGIDFSTNRYIVQEKSLSDFTQQTGFSWQYVNSLKIYSCVVTSNAVVDTHYIAFDAIRFDNISTQNPLYGLVGYTVVKNTNGEAIAKSPNTNNYVEFRMALDVGIIGDIP
jgi:hypothetical protein